MPDYPSWIPYEITIGYIEHGIQALLPWQFDVLNNRSLHSPKYGNVIFSAPTSSGKTIVAELITVNTIQQLHCKAMFIFPYISIAKEKFHTLQVSIFFLLNFYFKILKNFIKKYNIVFVLGKKKFFY